MSLPDSTSIHSVTLTVKDLGRALDFYEGVLGYVRQRHDGSKITLGASENGPGFLMLDEQRDAHQRPAQAPGLFHTAFLYPSRKELARVLKRVVQRGKRFQGFSDHLVSEALYLADPEGNGVELYADRPRDAWRWVGSSVQMATEPLDLEGLMAELDGDDAHWDGTPPDVRIGHIHLQVSDLEKAERFWADRAGFDVVTRDYPGALFVSAGGYHHHLGLNVWNSRGRSIPEGILTGLQAFSISVPTAEGRDQLATRLERSWSGNLLETSDLDGIRVSFVGEK
jgi:catechol 2,3-dioxygenase